MTFRIHFTVSRNLGDQGRMWATLGHFTTLDDARAHAGWAAQRYDTDVEIFDLERNLVVEDVPAPDLDDPRQATGSVEHPAPHHS